MNSEAVKRIGHLQAALRPLAGEAVNITLDVENRLRPARVITDYILQPAAWFLVWALLAKITGISL